MKYEDSETLYFASEEEMNLKKKELEEKGYFVHTYYEDLFRTYVLSALKL